MAPLATVMMPPGMMVNRPPPPLSDQTRPLGSPEATRVPICVPAAAFSLTEKVQLGLTMDGFTSTTPMVTVSVSLPPLPSLVLTCSVLLTPLVLLVGV